MMAGLAPTPMTPQTAATGLLRTLGDPVTPANVSSLVGWEAREGGNWHNTARYNPWNTTENAPGATAMNGVGVKSYLNWNQGLQATADTLRNGDYGDILGALHSGRGLEGNLAGLSKWSGGGYSSITPITSYGVGAGAPPTTSHVSGLGTPKVQGYNVPAVRIGSLAQMERGAMTMHLEQGSTQRIPGQHIATLAQLGDDPHTLSLAASMAISHDPRLGAFNSLVESADAVNSQHYNYEWGGGHNAGFDPTTGSGHGSGAGVGYDCSGVLSHVLHAAGLLNQPLVSGQFAELNRYIPSAQPGVGSGPHTITIYANAEHVFARIGDTYFGTSSENRGGGAGWIGTTTENNNADFTAWHINF